MSTTEQQKIQAAESFGEAASYYHQHAQIQKKVAEGLISSLIPWKGMIPPGPILEIGCGTGFLTKKLVEQFPGREIMVTDASGEMVEFCRRELSASDVSTENLSFEILNANSDVRLPEDKYAMVISNFAPQWFDDTSMTLEKLSESIQPSGLLLCSFPGNHSFSQWYENCLELGLPFTANPLPDVEEVVVKLSMGPLQIDYYENDLTERFDKASDFFRNLKKIGASESTTGKSLNAKQFRLLLNHWDSKAEGGIQVKWHIVYLAAKKDG